MIGLVESLFAFLFVGPVDADLPAYPTPPAIASPSAGPPIPAPAAPPARAVPTIFPTDCDAPPPAAFRAFFVRASRRHASLSGPCDLARQARQESGFRVDAISPAGAIGISQFLPATAAEFGVDPRDPESSIYGQARYVAWCQSAWTPELGGREVYDLRGLGLGCYNYGRGAMYRSQARHGWVRVCDALPHLPEETRHYIGVIERPPCSPTP